MYIHWYVYICRYLGRGLERKDFLSLGTDFSTAAKRVFEPWTAARIERELDIYKPLYLRLVDPFFLHTKKLLDEKFNCRQLHM
jgi:hypothetical protein